MMEMLKPVSTMGVLIMLFLFIFCILGMTLLGGNMFVAPRVSDIIHGSYVYLMLPDDRLASSLDAGLFLRGRPGVVEAIDTKGVFREREPERTFRERESESMFRGREPEPC